MHPFPNRVHELLLMCPRCKSSRIVEVTHHKSQRRFYVTLVQATYQSFLHCLGLNPSSETYCQLSVEQGLSQTFVNQIYVYPSLFPPSYYLASRHLAYSASVMRKPRATLRSASVNVGVSSTTGRCTPCVPIIEPVL